jgi:RNA polymerase sigma-70 factor (ECF subfamily)
MALRADDVDLVRDYQLVTRFQAGDAAAFEDLYRRYFGRLQRFCQRRVGDPLEAEELAQEAFAKALRAMPDFAGERRFYPWMTVIAARLCIDAARRKGRTTPVPDPDVGAAVDDVGEHLVREVERDHLAAALDRLAPRHREVLVLREQHGWSYQRIADHYGVTLGTVEAVLHRARKALRREFLRLSGESRMLAALPVVGWLVLRLQVLRARAPELTEVATPLAVKVASVVLAAGAAGLLGRPDPGSPAVAAPAPAPRPAVAVASAPAPAAAPATSVPAPAAPARASGTATPATPPTTAPSRVLTRVPPERARTFTDDAPVTVGVGPYSVGVDPREVVSGVQAVLDSLTRR